MSPGGNLRDRVASWLRRNRREAKDLLALAFAQLLVAWFQEKLPVPAALAAVVVAALVRFRPSPRPDGPWTDFLTSLPRRLAALAAAAAVLHWWLNQPLDFLWFGLAWVIIAAGVHYDWEALFTRIPIIHPIGRTVFLVASALWLMRGFAKPTLNGTSDALWYGTMLRDAVLQVRAGIFPIWVGQSIYQFNGAICPIRVAPAFPYLGIMLDFLTFGQLGTFALQNLLIALIGASAVGITYRCLSALLPGARWTAAGLTVIFCACPGVLGLAYNTDLYMSWTTLPLVPVVWFATIRSFEDHGRRRTLVLLGAALGLCWWGHSPIALWSTVIAGFLQLGRLAADRKHPIDWVALAGASAAFLGIAAYPVCSVLLYLPPGMTADSFALAVPGNVQRFLLESFPGVFLPLSALGLEYSDFQLGYALWAVLVFCLASPWRRWRPGFGLPLACAAILMLLLLPCRGLAVTLWSLVPSMLRNTAGNWAATRLCMPLAAATVFGCAGLVASGQLQQARRSVLAVIVAAGALWSLAEATKFGHGSEASTHSPQSAVDLLRPENAQITRFSYSMFPGFPDNFIHGVADPSLETFLLSPQTKMRILADGDSARSLGRELDRGTFRVNSALGPGISEVDRKFHLLPGTSYLLDFSFTPGSPTEGVLQLSAEHFFREYALPEYGGAKAFGVGGTHTSYVPVWTTAGPEDLVIRFFPQGTPADAADLPLGTVRLLSYSSDQLPVQVKGWMPFEAVVVSPQEAWLQTPRMFQAGYVATVDGNPAPVGPSPDGLTCVAVPKGRSNVRLAYHPPLGLALTFGLSVLSLIAVVAASLPVLRARLVGRS